MASSSPRPDRSLRTQCAGWMTTTLAAKRPDITLWSSNELDTLLRKWPAVVAEFGLID